MRVLLREKEMKQKRYFGITVWKLGGVGFNFVNFPTSCEKILHVTTLTVYASVLGGDTYDAYRAKLESRNSVKM